MCRTFKNLLKCGLFWSFSENHTFWKIRKLKIINLGTNFVHLNKIPFMGIYRQFGYHWGGGVSLPSIGLKKIEGGLCWKTRIFGNFPYKVWIFDLFEYFLKKFSEKPSGFLLENRVFNRKTSSFSAPRFDFDPFRPPHNFYALHESWWHTW